MNVDRFTYHAGKLMCEETCLEDVAKQYGTPLYVYSRDTLIDHFERFAQTFREINPLICFSAKALANVHLLREIGGAGAGIDAVSGGELHRAFVAGVEPDRIVFAGVGKSADELRIAVERGIRCINVESESEMDLVAEIARSCGKRPRVAIRVNPDVAPGDRTPAKTTTGTRGAKFGVDIERAAALFIRASEDEWLAMDGFHIHLGSPIFLPGVYDLALERLMRVVAELESGGHRVRSINVGGGYAAEYEWDSVPSWGDFAKVIVGRLRAFADGGGQVILEPGRTIAANSAVLLTTVRYLKQAGDNNVAIVDAGMSHFVRPAIYGSEHFIWPVTPTDGRVAASRAMTAESDGLTRYDIAGPICESSDYLGKKRWLPTLRQRETLCVFSTGAYGMTMASNYNSQPRPAEVLIDGDTARLIRRRETWADLVELELQCDSEDTGA